MHGHVILGKRRIDDAPGALVEQRLLHQRRADTHNDPAAKLAAGRFRVQDAAAVERAKPARNAHLARLLMDAELAKVHAIGVHRVLHRLEWQPTLGLRLDPRATMALQDCAIGFALSPVIRAKQAPVTCL